MQSFKIPGYGENENGLVTTHSIAFDRHGNLWFTSQTNTCPLRLPAPGIGYIDRNWQGITMLDGLKLARHPDLPPEPLVDDNGDIICGDNGRVLWSFTGIAIDEHNDIWFTNFYQRLVHRLVFQPRDLTN
jgi:hypothetical protein